MFVIGFIIAIALVICFLVAYFRLDEQPSNVTDTFGIFSLSDFTFRSDHGGEWVVTAVNLTEAWEILFDSEANGGHGVSPAYYNRHMFLAYSEPVL